MRRHRSLADREYSNEGCLTHSARVPAFVNGSADQRNGVILGEQERYESWDPLRCGTRSSKESGY
jgi:hypothetical protein